MRRLSYIITVIICLLPLLVTSAEHDYVKAGDVIQVPIEIEGNTGICSARIKISFDKNIFTLISQENGDIFPLSSFTAGNTEGEEFYALWAGLANVEKNGVLIKLNLKIADNATDGKYNINVSYDENDVFNLNEENINISISNPIIQIGTDKDDTEKITSSSSRGSVRNNKTKVEVVNQSIKIGSFDNFKKKNEFSGFEDVLESDWFFENIKFGYEYNFINGRSDKIFDPQGDITVAEAITLAAKVRAIYWNDTEPQISNSGIWYDNFVAYAINNKIIESTSFDNYDRAALRSEVAFIFSNALPTECYNRLNFVEKIVDMKETDKYYDNIIKLYISGILTGNDEIGTFSPDTKIKRCEAAAIINRVVLPSARLER